jgi:hypothetical protein
MQQLQFKPGLPMAKFERLYWTEEQCEDVVSAWRRLSGFNGPRRSSGCCTEFRRGALLYLR